MLLPQQRATTLSAIPDGVTLCLIPKPEELSMVIASLESGGTGITTVRKSAGVHGMGGAGDPWL